MPTNYSDEEIDRIYAEMEQNRKAPKCPDCEVYAANLVCGICGRPTCGACVMTLEVPLKQHTAMMIEAAMEKHFKWVRFLCPECHSNGGGYKH